MTLALPLIPTDIVIFGGMGDLSLRKILPALYYRHQEDQYREGFILGTGRSDLSREDFLAAVREACATHMAPGDFDPGRWESFARRLHYVQLDGHDESGFHRLAKYLQGSEREGRMFYLATPSSLFAPICAHLHTTGLITKSSRVVLEKPLGHDLASFCEINEAVLAHFREEQIYRIDHYLGKETVQNLMIIRFANNLFERVWNGDAIDHVQITVAEEIGIEGRAWYFDQTGALRDMVQNHLLQLLCLVAMEPPPTIDPHTVRDEKVKVLKALQPITGQDVALNTVRGQYEGYTSDIDHPGSETETFTALKVHVDNWRWSGVPFYLRTGKRLAKRYSEIVLQFRQVPHHLFPGLKQDPESNKLIIRIQPDESVRLQMISKVPGPGGYRLKPVHLNLSMAEAFEGRFPDAYERLLMDVVRGNPTLFTRSDEVESAWRWIDPIIEGWQASGQPPLPYRAGSWGPDAARDLIERDGRHWHETL